MDDLEDGSVQCVVTSPPYWGLRKYSGVPDLIWGGDADCEHEWIDQTDNAEGYTSRKRWQHQATRDNNPEGWSTDIRQHGSCSLCGAWRGSYGLEPTPELYVSHTIEVLREVRRVLRDDGVAFINIGDSYSASGGGAHKPGHANPGYSKSAKKGGVPHVGGNGIDGKEQSDSIAHDSASQSLCGECAGALRRHSPDTYDRLVQAPSPSSEQSSHSHTAPPIGHSESCRSASQGAHSEGAIWGHSLMPSLAGEPTHDARASTSPESSEQSRGGCLHCDACGACLDVLSRSSPESQVCARTGWHLCTDGKDDCVLPWVDRTGGKSPSSSHTYITAHNASSRKTLC